jgi:hypothetical protein
MGTWGPAILRMVSISRTKTCTEHGLAADAAKDQQPSDLALGDRGVGRLLRGRVHRLVVASQDADRAAARYRASIANGAVGEHLQRGARALESIQKEDAELMRCQIGDRSGGLEVDPSCRGMAPIGLERGPVVDLVDGCIV